MELQPFSSISGVATGPSVSAAAAGAGASLILAAQQASIILQRRGGYSSCTAVAAERWWTQPSTPSIGLLQSPTDAVGTFLLQLQRRHYQLMVILL